MAETTRDMPPARPGGPAPGGQPGMHEVDERTARKVVRKAYRPRRRIAATIVAALIALAAVLVAIEVIAALFNGSVGVLPVSALRDLGQDTAWNDPLTVTTAIVIGLLGLWLVWLAFAPGPVRAVPLRSTSPGTVLAAVDGTLTRIAERAAERVDGVDRARARGDRERVAVFVDTPLRDPGDLADRVRAAVADRIDSLAPLRPARIRVTTRYREG